VARGLREVKEALSMTIEHADLFHCLACGRIAYEPHGGAAPDCCGQPMVCAVADVVEDLPVGAATNSPATESQGRGELEEHALFAEILELSQWCHRLQDVDISRGEELANRLSVLHQALFDRFDDADGSGTSAVKEQRRQLMATFSRFVAQLRGGPSPFANWAQICDRLDELVAQFRQYVQTEETVSAEMRQRSHSIR
jgi:hypothetical protein